MTSISSWNVTLQTCKRGYQRQKLSRADCLEAQFPACRKQTQEMLYQQRLFRRHSTTERAEELQGLRAQRLTRAGDAHCYETLDADTERLLTARAEADAAALGLTLIQSKSSKDGSSGFSCVRKRTLKRKGCLHIYYEAYEYLQDHSQKILGTCRTAAEAALIVAKAKKQKYAGAGAPALNSALVVGAHHPSECRAGSDNDSCSQEL